MNKRKFISELRKKLSRLPRKEIEERLSFYSEMIDDHIEEGLSEEEAVRAVGSIENIAKQIPGAKGADSMKRELSGWDIALLIIGAPLWAPLLIAAFVIYFSLYIVLWSLVAVLWAVELPFLIFYYISKYLFVACKYVTIFCARLTRGGVALIGKSFRKIRYDED